MKKFLRIFTLLLAVILAAAVITGALILRKSHGSEEAVTHLIVLGTKVEGTEPSSMLQDRICAAAAYLSAHPEVVAVVTGGKGDAENLSEAQCMYNGLTALGIDGSRILMEDKATSTVENFIFSLALLEEELGSCPEKIGVLSSEFHLLRSAMLAKSHGITAVTVPAKTSDPATFASYFLREILMVWVDGIKLILN